jgi:hypothetical protein
VSGPGSKFASLIVVTSSPSSPFPAVHATGKSIADAEDGHAAAVTSPRRGMRRRMWEELPFVLTASSFESTAAR